MTILVIGGTGRVGALAMDTLLAAGATVRCLSHSEEKLAALSPRIERAFADLDDPASLPKAFDGVSGVLLSLAVHPNEAARGKAAITAAAAAGAKKLVHISVKHYPGSETRIFYQGKQAIERELANAPFRTTIIRPANFFQTDSTQKGYIIDGGVFAPPIGHVGVDRIDCRDVGYAAAQAFVETAYEGKDVDLYGPETFTGQSCADLYSRLLGRPIKYMGDDIERWAELNAPRLGPWYLSSLKGLYEQQQVYGMLRPAGEPQHPLLPRQLRRLEDYAKELIKVWTA